MDTTLERFKEKRATRQHPLHVTKGKLQVLKAAIDPVPGMSVERGVQIIAEYFGCTIRTAYRHLAQNGIKLALQHPYVREVKLCPCGLKAVSRGLCATHHKQTLRRPAYKCPAPEDARVIVPCAATADGKHDWLLWDGVSVCTRCSEPRNAVMRKRRDLIQGELE